MSSNKRHVLVIGGSHGISLDLVRLLTDRECQVTAVSRTPGPLKNEEFAGRQMKHIPCDVVESDLSGLSLPDSLTGFVYCPGSINLGPIKSAKANLMRQDFELNVVAAMKCFQAAIPALMNSESASAVFFSTVAVNRGIAMHSYVAAAKGALQALAKTWAAELAPKIRVNCVAPALTETPLSENLLATQEKRKIMAEKYPLGRYGRPTDIAEMSEFLLSDRSQWITGQTFGVDGGMSSIVSL